jgi:hypothetical protein
MTGSDANPTAFITWAHRQTGWTDAEATEWLDSVVAFAGLLRLSGIDADLDAFHFHDPDVDWTRYGSSQIQQRDFSWSF